MRPLVLEALSRWLGPAAAALLAPTYFTLAAIAALAGTALVVRHARRDHEDVPAILSALLAGYVGAIAGGILAPMLADAIARLAAGGPLRLRWAGMIAYGGFAGGLGAAFWRLRSFNPGAGTPSPAPGIPTARFADLVAAPIGLCIAVVRVGCFLAGCDYGKPSSLPWAVRFPAGSPAWTDHVRAGLVPATRASSLAVHPTQLYESLLGLLLLAAAIVYGRRAHRPGRVFAMVAVGYAVGRAAIETLRGDASRGTFAGASTSQLLGLVVLLLAGASLVPQRRRVLAGAVALALASLASTAHAEPMPRSGRGYDLVLVGGVGAAINRPDGQVPQLAGASLGARFAIAPPLSLGADLELMSNTVATHGTFVFDVALRWPLARSIDAGMQMGLGVTQVGFRDESFADVVAFDVRYGATLDWAIVPRFGVTVWPLGLDVVASPVLGGPIVSLQMRIGIWFGDRHVPAAPAPAPAAPAPVPVTTPPVYPPGTYPPGTYPPGTYPPGTYPPGTYPPGVYPPGTYPPGAYPPGTPAPPPPVVPNQPPIVPNTAPIVPNR